METMITNGNEFKFEVLPVRGGVVTIDVKDVNDVPVLDIEVNHNIEMITVTVNETGANEAAPYFHFMDGQKLAVSSLVAWAVNVFLYD